MTSPSRMKGEAMIACGLDFGTSNSAIGVARDGVADARAQAVLHDVARQAGFRDIAFVYEPIAAAYHYESTVKAEELVLVADIGGGTSDFSVIRLGPTRRKRVDRDDDILA